MHPLWRCLAFAAVLAACGPPARGPVYPSAQFLVAEGEGASRPAAEQAARARIAEQISAHIEATFEVASSSLEGQESQRISEIIRSKSTFAHAELIEVVEAHCAGDRCTARAVLRRGRADAVLAQAYAEPAARFRRAAEAATQAASIVGFTQHLRAAEDAWPPVAALAAQRQGLLGGAPDEVVADRARRATLLAARDHRRQALRISVLPGEAPGEPTLEAVRAALAAALADLGLAARTADACTEGLALVPRGQVVCGPGAFGPRCTLDLVAELAPCPAGAPLATLDLRGAKLAGASPQGEAEARRQLLQRATAERLAPTLAPALRGVLPLP